MSHNDMLTILIIWAVVLVMWAGALVVWAVALVRGYLSLRRKRAAQVAHLTGGPTDV